MVTCLNFAYCAHSDRDRGTQSTCEEITKRITIAHPSRFCKLIALLLCEDLARIFYSVSFEAHLAAGAAIDRLDTGELLSLSAVE